MTETHLWVIFGYGHTVLHADNPRQSGSRYWAWLKVYDLSLDESAVGMWTTIF